MAARIRCSEWEKDEQLKNDLERYVLANYSRQEILDFASRGYPEYAWSLPTLSRRLNFFGIKYIRYETSIEDVKKAVQEEMEGPGQYLGYRAMQRKLREQHKLAVPCNLVYDVMGGYGGPRRTEEARECWSQETTKGSYRNVHIIGKILGICRLLARISK